LFKPVIAGRQDLQKLELALRLQRALQAGWNIGRRKDHPAPFGARIHLSRRDHRARIRLL
jgi:hypothetical protein